MMHPSHLIRCYSDRHPLGVPQSVCEPEDRRVGRVCFHAPMSSSDALIHRSLSWGFPGVYSSHNQLSFAEARDLLEKDEGMYSWSCLCFWPDAGSHWQIAFSLSFFPVSEPRKVPRMADREGSSYSRTTSLKASEAKEE